MQPVSQKTINQLTRQVEALERQAQQPPRQVTRRAYALPSVSQLPENPNPEQLKAVFALTIESVYQDGVDEILEGPTLKGKTIMGKFREGRKIFDVKIANGEIAFQPAAGMTDKEFGG